MPCNNCLCEQTCESFARCVREPIPEDYEAGGLGELVRQEPVASVSFPGPHWPGKFLSEAAE